MNSCLNPMAPINVPDFYTCTQCQASQPAGFNYCGACGAPIIPKNEIPSDVREQIRNIGAIIWPRSLAYRSTIGGASGKRLRTTPSELRFKQEDRHAFELNCKKLQRSQTKSARGHAGCVDRYAQDPNLRRSNEIARISSNPDDTYALQGWDNYHIARPGLIAMFGATPGMTEAELIDFIAEKPKACQHLRRKARRRNHHYPLFQNHKDG